MQRRTFLKAGIGSGAAAALLPAWSAAQALGGQHSVSTRLHAARVAGKPVLVLLLPEEPERYARLQLWSELLALASDATLAELALCEVACATPVEAAAAARSAGVTCPPLEAEDLAVLLETGAEPPRRISGRDLPTAESPRFFGGDEAYERSARARATALAERVRAALLPDAEALGRRATAAEATLDEGLRMTLVLEHRPRPRLAHLDRAAAVVLAMARAERSAEKEANLARAALQRLWEGAPDGAQWTSSTGYCPPCGMGHVPAVSRHFLTVYTG